MEERGDLCWLVYGFQTFDDSGPYSFMTIRSSQSQSTPGDIRRNSSPLSARRLLKTLLGSGVGCFSFSSESWRLDGGI